MYHPPPATAGGLPALPPPTPVGGDKGGVVKAIINPSGKLSGPQVSKLSEPPVLRAVLIMDINRKR